MYAETTGNLPAATLLNQSYSDIYYATDRDAEDLAVNQLARRPCHECHRARQLRRHRRTPR